MLLKKYFVGSGRNFSAPPARPTHAEVRERIDPQEGDHRASYMPYGGLQLFRQHRPGGDIAGGKA